MGGGGMSERKAFAFQTFQWFQVPNVWNDWNIWNDLERL